MREITNNEQDSEIAALRNMICKNFPDEKFDGMQFPGDQEEMDEERDLYYGLNGLKWSEVPKNFIRANPSQKVLLRDAAFLAFFPAWLLESLEDSEGENEVREYMIYTFSPQQDSSGQADKLRYMNASQRATIRSVLEYFARHESSEFLREYATSAVAFIDEIAAN